MLLTLLSGRLEGDDRLSPQAGLAGDFPAPRGQPAGRSRPGWDASSGPWLAGRGLNAGGVQRPSQGLDTKVDH